MSRYLVRRFVELIPTVFLVTIFVFVIMRLLPGDPFLEGLDSDERLTDEQLAILRHEAHLDRSWPEQYGFWLEGIVTGDWGRTLTSRQPVADLVLTRARVSFQLGLVVWLTALSIAIPIGVLSALYRNSWFDVSITIGALAGLAAPNFVVALFLIIFVAVEWQLLPTRGFVPFTENPIEWGRHLVLPVITLATASMASTVRQMRSAVLEVMREDYIRTAQAKGLRTRVVVFRHMLRNAMLPIITLAGLQIGHLISGSIIVESIFGIQGMGALTIQSVLASDYQTIQILVLIFACVTITGNLLADITYTLFDPRIRLQ